jgi:hypothetical protein
MLYMPILFINPLLVQLINFDGMVSPMMITKKPLRRIKKRNCTGAFVK